MKQLTVQSILEYQASTNPDFIAIETESGFTISYRELSSHVTALSSGILETWLHQDGDRKPRVGIVMPNGAEIALVMLASACVGIAIPFNPSYKAYEYESYFSQTKIDLLIVQGDDTGPAVQIANSMGIRILRFSMDQGLWGATGAGVIPRSNEDEIALILMTSGSTGRPKIVPLSHRNICTSAYNVAETLELTPHDKCLVMWEQYHIGGLVDLLLAPLVSGGCAITTRGFSASNFYTILVSKRPTWFQAVPTSLNELVQFNKRNVRSDQSHALRFIRAVASPLQSRLYVDLEELFSVPIIHTFGMTEAGPLVSSTRLPPNHRAIGSSGLPINTDVAILGETGRLDGSNETGEVIIRGPSVFSGYEGAEETNKERFIDGWFRTGDLGHLDDHGELFITGRIKELISRGGEKFSPNEIEDVLLLNENISEAAVFSIRHETLDEEVAAAVVLKRAMSVDEIKKFVGEKLASFKIPKVIVMVDKLPLNPIGKIDKLALSEACMSGAAQAKHIVAPTTPLEEFIHAIWVRELPAQEFGIEDEFSILGGDSLSSIRILVAIEREYGIHINDEDVDSLTTIASLARYVAGRTENN